MLKIRLSRIGGKQRPFYRVVVVEERSKRTGSYVELLGTYNPLSEPKEIKLKQDRIDYWIKQGAQPSVGYLRIIGKAPQRPPRKAKKEKKADSAPSSAEPKEEPKSQPVEEKIPEEAAKLSEPEAVSEVVAANAEQSTPVEEVVETPSAEGDSEEVSSGVAAASEASEDAPEETEPAGPSSEEAKPEGEKDEGSA